MSETTQTAPAQDAREAIRKAADAIEAVLVDECVQGVETLARRGNTGYCGIARQVVALRALLATPPAADSVARLVEAGEAALTLIDEVRKQKAHYWEGEGIQRRLAAALAAHRASLTPLGAHRLQAERDLAIAERDEARKERDKFHVAHEMDLRVALDLDQARLAVIKERDALKADLAKLRADPPAPAPLDPRAVAIYEGAVRLRSGRITGTLGDCVREAGELLRGAEQEAAK